MNKILQTTLTFLVLFIATGCTKEPTYTEQLNIRPLPKTKQDIQQECSYIRQEIARMQSLYQQASTQKCNPQYGLCLGALFMQKSTKNIASLKSRASNIQCDAAFSTVKVLNTQNSSIKECIEACKENTKRTSAECFDTCNK